MNNVSLQFNCGTGILPVTENAAQCAIDLTYSSTIYLHLTLPWLKPRGFLIRRINLPMQNYFN
ncbi:hypothetical protein QUB69_28905, partial [Microcoleus sp. AT13-A6]|uniref:hypothetical protein n=1 Tax=unclassified Microcoleus TaxID=2642155 RepID=UPI002FD4527A